MPYLGVPSSSLAVEDEDLVTVCATCEMEVPWTPVQQAGKAFCCAGCAAGGPCTCSYDEFNAEDSSMAIANTILDTGASPRRMPMTRDVFRRLEIDVERLVAELPTLQTQARVNGVSGDPESPTVLAAADLHLASRRLEMLRRVIADARIAGRITPDSPLGAALAITAVSAPAPPSEIPLTVNGTEERRDIVYEQSVQSFPASDPPSWPGASI